MTGAWPRLGILGSLYVVQGIVYGFGGFILVPSMAAAGVALDAQAGVLALSGVPWVLKLLWAPLLDRFGGVGSGRARWFAAAAMGMMALALLGLASREQLVAEPVTLAWLWLVVNVALSLQDVATDALVIDRVPRSQRGLANGVLLGGHHLGAEGVGGLGLGLVVASQGLSAALWVQAGLLAVMAGLPLLLPRQAPGGRDGGASDETRSSRPDATSSTEAGLARTVGALIRSPRALAVAGLAALLMSADVLTATVSGQLWVQRLGWSVEELSTMLAPMLLGANLVAYALATVAVDRLGHVRAAMGGSAALGLLWAGFGLLPGLWTSSAFLAIFVGLQAVATSVFYVGVHAALMNATQPQLRASHFAVLMALLNLPRAAVAPGAPAMLEALGYSGLFIVAGVFQVVMAAVIGWVRPGGGRGDVRTTG